MVYANTTDIETLTKEIKNDASVTDEEYTALQTKASSLADKKINNKLRVKNVPIPTSLEDLENNDPLNDLIEAGNLFAAALMFDTYYAGNETPSPSSKTYKDDANSLVDGYITWYNSKDNTSVSDPPSIIITYLGGDEDTRD